MKTLLQKLVKENIHLTLNEGELSVKIPKTGVDPAIINEIKTRKLDLIEYLSNLTDPNKAEIPVLTKQENYPLSLNQKRIWNLCKLEKGSVAHNIPGSVIIEIIDKDRFLQALDAVIDRHEILRTVFKINELGEVRQYVLPREDIRFKIDYFDFRKEENKEERLKTIIDTDAFVPFDLENGPLFRAFLFRIKGDKHLLYYNMHSIAFDGESIEIFTRDAMAFSEALKINEVPDLQELNIQYKEFANWQIKRLEKNELKEYKEYWLDHLSGNLSILDMPNQKERPRVKTFSGRLLGTNITVETSEKLKDFVNEKGGNLFMGIMASWKVFLNKCTSEEDLILGTPALGRDHPDLENQIGPYINTIAVRNQLDPNENFLSFYNKVKDTVSKSYAFQMYPYEKIVEDLKLNKDESRNPIFDIVLLLQREEQMLGEFPLTGNESGTIIEGGIGKKYVNTVVAKYDMEIDFRELGGCLWFNINYNTDLYEKDTIVNFMNSYKNLLNQMLDDYMKPIINLPNIDILTPEQI